MNRVSKFITIIRPEFMIFCKDACRAAAFNHLLFRIAYKCKDQMKRNIQDGKVLWYAKTDLLVEEMSGAWKSCKVRSEVNALVKMGLIGRCSNPEWAADRTKHFFFGKRECATFIHLCEENNICIVHLGLPPEVVHLIYSSNANDKSIKCSCLEQVANDESINSISLIHQMQMINSSNANDKFITAITKNSSKNSSKINNEEGEDGAPTSFCLRKQKNDNDSNPSPGLLSNSTCGHSVQHQDDHPEERGNSLQGIEQEQNCSGKDPRAASANQAADSANNAVYVGGVPAARARSHAGDGARHESVRVDSSKKRDPLAGLSDAAKDVVREWQEARGDFVVSQKVREHAETLAEDYKVISGEIKACIDWMLATDKKGYFKSKPLYLGDVVNGIASFRKLPQQGQKVAIPAAPPTPKDDPEREAKLEKCRLIKEKLIRERKEREEREKEQKIVVRYQ